MIAVSKRARREARVLRTQSLRAEVRERKKAERAVEKTRKAAAIEAERQQQRAVRMKDQNLRQQIARAMRRPAPLDVPWFRVEAERQARWHEAAATMWRAAAEAELGAVSVALDRARSTAGRDGMLVVAAVAAMGPLEMRDVARWSGLEHMRTVSVVAALRRADVLRRVALTTFVVNGGG